MALLNAHRIHVYLVYLREYEISMKSAYMINELDNIHIVMSDINVIMKWKFSKFIFVTRPTFVKSVKM